MSPKKQSVSSRALEIVPVFPIVGLGVVGVILAMNILVTVAPILSNGQPTPSPTFTFPVTPSIGPMVMPTPVVTPVVTASLPDHKPTLVHTQITDKDPDGVWYYYISYPAFVTGSTPWADSIDVQIADMIATSVQRWQAGPASVRQAQGKKNNLTGDFAVDLLTPSLASFTLTWLDDTMPRRPATSVSTITYDLGSGAPIVFDDMFIDPVSAVDMISLQAKQTLRDQLGAAYNPDVTDIGVAAIRTNFTHWALTAGGLKITFDQEQVAEYSAGNPSIVIPWSFLRPFMVTTGPIAVLAVL